MSERSDIVESLQTHRRFLLRTVDDVSEADARRRTTVSELTLGGIVKHVALTEQQWVAFILEGPGVMEMTPETRALSLVTCVPICPGWPPMEPAG